MLKESVLSRKIKNLLPNEVFLKMQYYAKTGKTLHLKYPTTFSEKIQWLKINYKNVLLNKLVDKYEVREYIKDKVGIEYLIELYGVFDKPQDINIDELPNKFVIKTTHGSGMILFCYDKSTFNWDDTFLKLDKWLKINWYYYGREWAYKNLKPRIICERLMLDKNNNIPNDYKLYCFNGEPKAILVVCDRYKTKKLNGWYDPSWNKIPITCQSFNNISDFPKPEKLDEMLKISRILSKDFAFVRVDLYDFEDRLFFGELTFYPGRGLELLEPEKYEKLFGDYIKLPKGNI